MAFLVLLLLVSSAFAHDEAPKHEAALAADDECQAQDQCALNALQLRSRSDTQDSAAFGLNATSFRCNSNVKISSVKQPSRKGICLDDTTYEFCSGEIPALWPHTESPITTVRLFKAWGVQPPTIFHTDRKAAWATLKAYADTHGTRFLLGTSVGCDKPGDEEEWGLAKEFMKYVGPDHIMGLAIGNELELLFQKDAQYQNPECLKGLFEGKLYEKEFNRRVTELDAMGAGFSSVPVTAVFGMYALAGKPFVQQWNSGVSDFLKAVWHTYGGRFVFTFNLYPYFDPSSRCTPASIKAATDFQHGMVPGAAQAVRGRMRDIGAGGARLWVGETGWSTPQTASIATSVAGCAEFSSEATFKNFYANFLDWDLSSAGVDHVFYFAIHDSKNFDAPEHFGLIGQCGSSDCKLKR